MSTLIYCGSCGCQMDHSDQCSRCGWDHRQQSAPPSVYAATPIPTLKKKKIQCRVKLFIDIDRTASSVPFSDAIIRQTIPPILRGIESKAAEVLVWLMSHGDLDFSQFPVFHADGVSVDQALAELPSIVFSGGGDPRESHLDGLEHLLNTVPYTNDQRVERGVVISFMTDESKPLRSTKSPTQLGKEFARAGFLTYLVCETDHRRLSEFAMAANAMMIPISKNPGPDMIRDIVSRVSASLVQTLSTGGTIPLDIFHGSPV